MEKNLNNVQQYRLSLLNIYPNYRFSSISEISFFMPVFYFLVGKYQDRCTLSF